MNEVAPSEDEISYSRIKNRIMVIANTEIVKKDFWVIVLASQLE